MLKYIIFVYNETVIIYYLQHYIKYQRKTFDFNTIKVFEVLLNNGIQNTALNTSGKQFSKSIQNTLFRIIPQVCV